MALGGFGRCLSCTPGNAFLIKCSMWVAEQTFTSCGTFWMTTSELVSAFYREIHPGIRQIFFIIDRGGIDRTLHLFQGQRNQVRGHDSFQQRAQFLVQVGEDRTQRIVRV